MSTTATTARRSLTVLGAVVATAAVAAVTVSSGLGSGSSAAAKSHSPRTKFIATQSDTGAARVDSVQVSKPSSPTGLTDLAGHEGDNSPTGGALKRTSEDRVLRLPPRTDAYGRVVSPYSSMRAYLNASIDDVHRTFRRLAPWTPRVNYVFPDPGQRFNSSCGMSSDHSLEYCPADDRITFSQSMAVALWNGRYGQYSIGGTGDMSVTLFMAHEYGHNLIRESGRRVSAANNERAADCFGGVYARDADRRGILELGDVTEAWNALWLLAEHPGHTDGIHGFPADRRNAFSIGWYYGFNGCLNNYAR